MDTIKDNDLVSIIKAIRSLANDQLEEAKRALLTINSDALQQNRADQLAQVQTIRHAWSKKHRQSAKRSSVAKDLQEYVFQRDHYLCCYCGKQTIDLRVLKALSKIFPEVFPYQKNWKFGESHLIYWTHSTSIEHVAPVADGGDNAAENLRASCYLCNDVKKDIPLNLLGWKLRPIPTETVEWQGLTEYLPKLMEVKS